MSRSYVQAAQNVLTLSGTAACNALYSGSVSCRGYTTLVGAVWSAGSTVAACGLRIDWSFDNGANFDYTSASNALASGASAACSLAVLGDYVRVRVQIGATGASRVAGSFYLLPT